MLRIGILGYGNLGKAVEMTAKHREDIKVEGIFSRRKDVMGVYAPMYHTDSLSDFEGRIDVMIVCCGSSRDTPDILPPLAKRFNTVDTYDNHKKMSEYKQRVHRSAASTNHTSVIAFGWDPGLMSLMRLYLCRFIPNSYLNTFWGRGVSQGHTEALKSIDGVIDAIEYTVPREDALTLASLVGHTLDDTDRHRRVCYIACEKGKEDSISDEVLSMPDYFSGYKTELHFVDKKDFLYHKSVKSHRGRIYALGSSGKYRENKHSAMLDLEIGSNPEFTAHIALLGAEVCHALALKARYGAFSVFDIPPSILFSDNESVYL